MVAEGRDYPKRLGSGGLRDGCGDTFHHSFNMRVVFHDVVVYEGTVVKSHLEGVLQRVGGRTERIRESKILVARLKMSVRRGKV